MKVDPTDGANCFGVCYNLAVADIICSEEDVSDTSADLSLIFCFFRDYQANIQSLSRQHVGGCDGQTSFL